MMPKMAQKDKELTLPEKVKSFLRLKPSSQTQAEYNNMKGRPEEFVLTPDLVKDISPDTSVNHRFKTMKRLIDENQGRKLEKHAVESIWLSIADLLQPQQPKSYRQNAYEFIKFIIVTQYSWLDVMRATFFQLLSRPDLQEDLLEKIDLLKLLTRNGNEIVHFEEEIGPFLCTIASAALSSSASIDFLTILINLIKFNSAYLDKSDIHHIVSVTCHYACATRENEGVELSLTVIDVVIRFSSLPTESLELVIRSLCHTVNVEAFCQSSLKLMKNLMGTHLGHTALYTLCSIMEKTDNKENGVLLRGAVFFTGMSLWGSQRVLSLKLSHSVVLPFFAKALEGNNMIVALEISLSIQRLVKKYGEELHPETWDLVMHILEILLKQIVGRSSQEVSLLTSNVHETLSLIEQFYSDNKFNGCEAKLFSILEKCAEKRPESSVLRLLCYKTSFIFPLKGSWLSSLKLIIDSFYRREAKTRIRIKVLELIGEIYRGNRYIYEDEIVDKIILNTINNIELDHDLEVRNSATQLLLLAAQDCNYKYCLQILDTLSKVIERPFDQSHYPGGRAEAQEVVHVITEPEIMDVKIAIIGLANLLEKKMYELPSSVAINILKILLRHLHLQYEHSIILRDTGHIRLAVFESLLKLRADENRRLGIYNPVSGTLFSPYILCCYSEKFGFGPTSPPVSPNPSAYPLAAPTVMNLDSYFHAIIQALKREKDWTVLKCILNELPKLLQNKTLILSSPSYIADLCQGICSLIGDQNLHLPETLRNSPVTLSKPEFHAHVYPIETALVSYHKYFDPTTQQLLVTNLKRGITSKCAPICISALADCTLEMNSTMNKLLPNILLALSKISATVNIATSVLELLSTMIRFPNLYSSFTQDQFMSIFAIATPYTNPFKFNHYTVSLAHHVIAMWFIKCRCAYRKDFVSFIIRGLKNNVLMPMNEGMVTRTEKESEKGSSKKAHMPEELITFHYELTETCIDLLNRYTFCECSSLPKRSPIAEFLLSSGQQATWILGNSVITITTSGCKIRLNRYGLCDKCLTTCKKGIPDEQLESEAANYSPPEENESKRKRHQSAQVRRSMSMDSEAQTTKDDLQLHKMSKDDGMHSGSSVCSCWCKEWAEIMIRRPTGNTSWMMRIQNRLRPNENINYPLEDIANLLFTSQQLRQTNSKPLTKFGHERIDSESLEEKEHEALVQDFLKDSSVHKDEESKIPTPSEGNLEPNFLMPTIDQSHENPNSFSSLELPEPRLEATTSTSRLKGAPLKLPKQIHSPIYNTASAPLSPLPLLQQSKQLEDLQPSPRDRCNTIAVMSPVRPKIFPGLNTHIACAPIPRRNLEPRYYGIDPRFVFLQLFHSFKFGSAADKPIYLKKSELVDRALKVLDHIPPYDTHKIGVLYVGPGQTDSEAEILANECGSTRYVKFLKGLGNLIRLKDINEQEIYTGGLELTGKDGAFAYCWKDDVMQIIFHVATLMPTRKTDPSCNQKKLHIGNDYVSIVYNDSGKDYNMHTLKGQFMYACVIIHPLDYGSNLVILKTKPELSALIGNYEPKIISENNLALLVRQMALHANLASMILQSQQRSSVDPYASNWLERLRHIRRLREKRVPEPQHCDEDGPAGHGDPTNSQNLEDFTRFV